MAQHEDHHHDHQCNHKPIPRQYTLGSISDNNVSACPNSDFSMGDFTNWKGYYGNFYNPNMNIGFISVPPNERHLIIPAPGTIDPFGTNVSGGNEELWTVYPGEAFSARLGNSAVGAQAEQLTYDITIGPQTDFFIYRYAVVLNDNGHDPDEQPSFEIDIIDQTTGEQFDSVCGYYYVYAQPNLPGWITSPMGGGSGGAAVYWKDWTTVGLAFDVSDYGRELTIVFTTKDCSPTGHFGYAYISAFCTSLSVSFQGCEGSNQVTMTGPPGFAEYEWTGPFCLTCPPPVVVGNGQVLVVNNAQTGDEYRLKLISFYNYPNCVIQKVTSTVAFTHIEANFTPAVNCIGNPSSFIDISIINQNATDMRIWDFGDGSPPDTVYTSVATHVFDSPGDYTVTMIRGTSDPCYDTAIIDITVTDIPPVITNLPDTLEICSGQSLERNLMFSQLSATATWSDTVMVGSAFIQRHPASQSGTVISDTITVTGSGDALLAYALTPRIGDCIGVPDTMWVVVHALPEPSVSGDAEACEGASGVVYATQAAMSDYTWNVTGGIITAGNTADSAVVTWNNPGSHYLTISYADQNGCYPSHPDTMQVTVHSNPVPAFIISSINVCEGSQNVTYSTLPSMSGYQWSISSGGIVTSGATSHTVQVNWEDPGSGTDRWIEVNYTDDNGCTAFIPSRLYVTVNALPNVNVTPPDLTICSGTSAQASFHSTIPGTQGNTVFNWNLTAPVAITPNNLTGTGNLNQLFSNSSNSPQQVTLTITGDVNGCLSQPATYSFTVNPVANTLLSSGSQTICSGSPTGTVNITSDIAGSSFTWSVTCDAGIRPPCPSGGNGTAPASFGNVTIFNDVTSPQNVTYTVTSSFDGCPGTGATHTVTVNPVADVTLPASGQTRCAGSPSAAVPLGTNVTGVTVDYTWSVSCSPGIVNCPPAGGSPLQISPVTLNLSGTTFVPQSAVYTITPAIGGCPGTPSTYTFTINPIPNISVLPADHPTICSGAATNFNLQSSVNSPSFSWSAAGQTHISPGSLTSQTDNPVQRNFTNSGTSPETVTFTLYASADGCTSLPATYTVNVNPVADVVLTSSEQTRCSGSPTATVPISTNITGTTVQYTWSVNCQGGILACPPPGGPANQLPSFTFNLDGSTFIQKTATYTITPSIGACTGTPSDYIVRINPIPDVTISPAAHPNICSAAPTSFTLHSQVTGPAFQWSASAGSAVTPATLSGQTDNPVNRVFTNNGVNIEPVNFSVIVSADGCSSLPFNYTVNVNPRPSVSFQSLPPNPANSQQVCSGTAFTSVPLQSNVTISGVSYAWNAVAFDPVNPTSAITGFTTPNSGNAIPGQNVVSSLLTQGIIRYNVTPTFTAGGAACNGDPAEYQVLVNPSPTVTLTPSDPTGQTICSESQSQPITFVPNASPSTYTWQAVEISGVSGAVASGTTDFIPAQTLNTTGPAQGFVKYQVTPIYQGGGTFTCPGGVSYSTIYVNPLPSPVISGRSLVCELQPDEKYSTPDIPGNSYTWTVTGATAIQQQNTREVSVTWGSYTNSPGTLLVTEVVNATGCQRSTPAYSVILQRRPIPVITGPVQFLCDGSSNHRYETAPGNSNYTWSVTGGSFTSGAGPGNNFAVVSWNSPGNHAITVNYINDLGCEGFPAGMLDLTIHPLPGTQITPGPGPDCEGEAHLYQIANDPQCSYDWSIAPVTRGIITLGQGDHQVKINWNSSGPAVINVTATNDTTTCTAPGSFSLEIHPKPVISFIPCFDLITTPAAKKFNLKGASPFVTGQAEFSGNRVALNSMTGLFEFDPFNAAPGIYPVYYSFTNNYGCAATSNPISINVQNPAPFSCGSELTDPRDGKKYNTALLGGRCWMTQNLNYGNKLADMRISQLDNCVPEKQCHDQDPNCLAIGGFYQWGEVLSYTEQAGDKGLCPPEWHVPTESEWQQLIDNLVSGSGPPHANALSGSTMKDSVSVNGFLALLTGVNFQNYQWVHQLSNQRATMFWSSSPVNQKQAVARGLHHQTPSISRYVSSRNNLFPVRCVKDL